MAPRLEPKAQSLKSSSLAPHQHPQFFDHPRQDLEDPIQLDGHTNQVKVKPKYYPTDWELSTARAVTVLRYLNERGGVPGRRLSSAGYGHERPLVDPRLPHSQRINKRVDVVILTALPDETRDLLAQAAAARFPTGRPGAGEEEG